MYGSHKLPVDSASRILPYASDARNQSGIPSSIEHLLNAHTRAITDINWSPFHPEVLASCSVDTWTWIWDLRMANSGSGRPAQGYSSWNASMTQVKWNRGIEHRIAASCDDKVLIWDDRFGALPLVTLETRQSKIYGLDWSLPGNERNNRLMTCSLDGTIKFWDLDSPSSRRVAAHYARIDQPESTIETLQPVWRARHLPFGHGAISVAQRGDTAATLWAYGSQEPVCRFEGHTDLVKEFVIRSRSGSNANLDDRTFQLVTWSKDQTLRLWPIMLMLCEHWGTSKVRRCITYSQSLQLLLIRLDRRRPRDRRHQQHSQELYQCRQQDPCRRLRAPRHQGHRLTGGQVRAVVDTQTWVHRRLH